MLNKPESLLTSLFSFTRQEKELFLQCLEKYKQTTSNGDFSLKFENSSNYFYLRNVSEKLFSRTYSYINGKDREVGYIFSSMIYNAEEHTISFKFSLNIVEELDYIDKILSNSLNLLAFKGIVRKDSRMFLVNLLKQTDFKLKHTNIRLDCQDLIAILDCYPNYKITMLEARVIQPMLSGINNNSNLKIEYSKVKESKTYFDFKVNVNG